LSGRTKRSMVTLWSSVPTGSLRSRWPFKPRQAWRSLSTLHTQRTYWTRLSLSSCQAGRTLWPHLTLFALISFSSWPSHFSSMALLSSPAARSF
jgi:hypothetical protein